MLEIRCVVNIGSRMLSVFGDFLNLHIYAKKWTCITNSIPPSFVLLLLPYFLTISQYLNLSRFGHAKRRWKVNKSTVKQMKSYKFSRKSFIYLKNTSSLWPVVE